MDLYAINSHHLALSILCLVYAKETMVCIDVLKKNKKLLDSVCFLNYIDPKFIS